MPDGIPKQEVEIPRVASLVADGKVAFPTDLSPQIEGQLVQSVRALQRKKFISLIARLIALDICDEEAKKDGTHDLSEVRPE